MPGNPDCSSPRLRALLIRETDTTHTPESLAGQLKGMPGVVLLRSGLFDSPQARYSFVAAQPFLTFRSWGTRCELRAFPAAQHCRMQSGNPWQVLGSLMSRFKLSDQVDLPFPLGGCFGYWGYDLKHFVEPKLPHRAADDLGLPDCQAGFYDSLVVFDHRLGKAWVVSTGLLADGSRSERRAREQLAFWRARLQTEPAPPSSLFSKGKNASEKETFANFSRADFIARVERAQAYIRSGDIYQVNLSQRLAAQWPAPGFEFFQRLSAVSPAPFSAYLDCGEFQIASSSPELFLRMSGPLVQTRPIKGTRPRAVDPARDAQLAHELQTSAKEMAELIMITDLLRNDLGKVCEYGSVHVPDLACLERYPQVQHLVSTVEGRLRPDVTHLAAFGSCFPGGSITGAPKFRAMEIIDELEPNPRGPYTGALGYLGFNGESQLSIIIRTAICHNSMVYFHTGAGIVADSDPAAEYEETLAKAGGFLAALGWRNRPPILVSTDPSTKHLRQVTSQPGSQSSSQA